MHKYIRGTMVLLDPRSDVMEIYREEYDALVRSAIYYQQVEREWLKESSMVDYRWERKFALQELAVAEDENAQMALESVESPTDAPIHATAAVAAAVVIVAPPQNDNGVGVGVDEEIPIITIDGGANVVAADTVAAIVVDAPIAVPEAAQNIDDVVIQESNGPTVSANMDQDIDDDSTYFEDAEVELAEREQVIMEIDALFDADTEPLPSQAAQQIPHDEDTQSIPSPSPEPRPIPFDDVDDEYFPQAPQAVQVSGSNHAPPNLGPSCSFHNLAPAPFAPVPAQVMVTRNNLFTCAICLDEYAERCLTTRCGHMFCEECLLNMYHHNHKVWLKLSDRARYERPFQMMCPACREPVRITRCRRTFARL